MFLTLVGTYYSSVSGLDSKIAYRLTHLALNPFGICGICHIQSDVTCTKKYSVLTGSLLYLFVRHVVLS